MDWVGGGRNERADGVEGGDKLRLENVIINVRFLNKENKTVEVIWPELDNSGRFAGGFGSAGTLCFNFDGFA